MTQDLNKKCLIYKPMHLTLFTYIKVQQNEQNTSILTLLNPYETKQFKHQKKKPILLIGNGLNIRLRTISLLAT